MEKQSIKLKRVGDDIQFFSDIQKGFYSHILKTVAPDQEVWLTLSDKKPLRTEAQNRYYWLYLGIIADETGEDKDVLHEYFKNQFLLPKIQMYREKKVHVFPSTTKLTIREFMDYIKKIERDSDIPAPDTSLNGLDSYFHQL